MLVLRAITVICLAELAESLLVCGCSMVACMD